jgi:hypothetical protein
VRKIENVDELAKLGSSWALVPTGLFMQELHEPSFAKALAKVNKAADHPRRLHHITGP